MHRMRIKVFLALFILVLISSSSLFASTERRIALVIGNGSYDFGRLRNSVNDANDMAATLKKLGFSVILKNNVSHKEMETAIKELGRQLKKDDVGFFFYAGHGVQIEGQNYLIPIGANIEEAIGAQSKDDFVHKLSISYKEARETEYWIKLLAATGYINKNQENSLLQDNLELLKILGSIRKNYLNS